MDKRSACPNAVVSAFVATFEFRRNQRRLSADHDLQFVGLTALGEIGSVLNRDRKGASLTEAFRSESWFMLKTWLPFLPSCHARSQLRLQRTRQPEMERRSASYIRARSLALRHPLAVIQPRLQLTGSRRRSQCRMPEYAAQSVEKVSVTAFSVV
jgi:hypothetical protein